MASPTVVDAGAAAAAGGSDAQQAIRQQQQQAIAPAAASAASQQPDSATTLTTVSANSDDSSSSPGGLSVTPSAAAASQPASQTAAAATTSTPPLSAQNQSLGVALDLQRRWVGYQLQQLGRAAVAPISSARRVVSEDGWEQSWEQNRGELSSKRGVRCVRDACVRPACPRHTRNTSSCLTPARLAHHPHQHPTTSPSPLPGVCVLPIRCVPLCDSRGRTAA